MIRRSNIYGSDRGAVFEVLRSFDHVHGTDEENLRRTLGLIDLKAEGLAATKSAFDGDDLAEARRRLSIYYRSRKQPACRLESTPFGNKGADEVLKNVFSFYGETHDLGPDIDWEHNPGTGHWGHDLSRFTYLHALVGAFQESEDRRYGEKAVALILDWISKADICDAFIPKQSPYVWMSYLNIHIHLHVWAEALEYLLPEGFVSDSDLPLILKSVHDQLAYLEIVIPEQDSNWVVFGATGMLETSLFWHELRDSDRWVDYAWDRYKEQLDNQVLPDGVQFELTQHYHYGVARSYVVANCLTRRAGREVPARSREVVGKMIHYLHQTVTPDGNHLSFNDSDPNCGEGVARFVTAPSTLEACGVETSRVTGGTSFEDLPCEAFPCAGVYFLRDRDLYMAFDGGPYGAHHQHEDKLSFWLAAYGRTLIVDPGRYLYDNTTPFRGYLMSTRAHNTILVDGHGQSSRPHTDRYYSREPLENLWEVGDDRARVGAEYALGYGKESIPVTHRRFVLFMPGKYWILLDRLEGEGTHHLESRFQFMPGDAEIQDNGVVTQHLDSNILVLPEARSGLTPHLEIGQEEPRGGWYSHGYNLIEAAPQAGFEISVELPFGFATLLLPFQGPTAPPATLERTDSPESGYRVVVDGEESFFSEAEIACD